MTNIQYLTICTIQCREHLLHLLNPVILTPWTYSATRQSSCMIVRGIPPTPPPFWKKKLFQILFPGPETRGPPSLDLGLRGPRPGPWTMGPLPGPGGTPCEQTNWKHYFPSLPCAGGNKWNHQYMVSCLSIFHRTDLRLFERTTVPQVTIHLKYLTQPV